MRGGHRISGQAAVLYLKRDESLIHARFGFVVSKQVGGAVTRNLVKRRLRAIARELLQNSPNGYDLVIRALPPAAEFDWNRLQQEVLGNAKVVLAK